jgi:hypothetical protein
VTLSLVNPVSGSQEATESVPRTEGSQTTTAQCVSPDEPASPRSDFSPNWEYVTSQDQTVEQDGSTHVGIVSIATGQLIDLTAETSTTGFSASVNVDNNPTFDEVTGDVWFDRGGSSTSETTGTLYDCPSPYRTCSAKGTDVRGSLFTVVNGAIIYQGSLSNPAGTLTVSPGSFPQPDVYITAAGTYDPGNPEDQPPPITTITSSAAPYFLCTPLTWITNTSFLCRDGELGGTTPGVYYLVSGASAEATALTASPVIPTNQRNNSDPIASLSGTQFVFDSSLGSGSTSLYTAMIGPAPSNPQEVPNSGGLSAIAWQ